MPRPPPQDPTFKPCPVKTHLLLPLPVSYVGDCVRTAPYTHPDHARYEGRERTRRPAVCLGLHVFPLCVWGLSRRECAPQVARRVNRAGGQVRPLSARRGPAEGTSHLRDTHTCSRHRSPLLWPVPLPLARADASGNTLFPPRASGTLAEQRAHASGQCRRLWGGARAHTGTPTRGHARRTARAAGDSWRP